MYYGRLITGGKKVKVPWFILAEEKYTPSECPTAVLGKKFAEETFGKDRVFVLDREIEGEGDVIWIYGKTENRSKHNEELETFFNSCFMNKMRDVGYNFINIFTEPYSYFKKVIKFIDSDKKKSVYVTDRHVYVYAGKSNVAGLSLYDCKYAGISPKKVVARITENPSNTVFTDDSFLSKEDKKFLNGNKILVPVLHFNYYSTFSR